MPTLHQNKRLRGLLNAILLQGALLVVTIAFLEAGLRVLDLRYLRSVAGNELVQQSRLFRFDSEVGWSPTPSTKTTFSELRTIRVSNNSEGLRDIEHDSTFKPTLLFVGDSYVWGYNVEADERFTEILRRRLPSYRIVNAGVSGFGTDQEYLWLRRLWPRFEPSIVILIYCAGNDREDNSLSRRYEGYFKPYIVRTESGHWEWRQLPVPKSHRWYFENHWLPRHSYIARVIIAAYVALQNPLTQVPDPTEHLIGMMHDLVVARNSRLLVGIQGQDPRIEKYLQERNIPFATLESAEDYAPNDPHWTPKGHELVANRILAHLLQTGAVSLERP